MGRHSGVGRGLTVHLGAMGRGLGNLEHRACVGGGLPGSGVWVWGAARGPPGVCLCVGTGRDGEAEDNLSHLAEDQAVSREPQTRTV